MKSTPELGESTPLIQSGNHGSQTTPSFSILRARIVAIVIPVLTLSAASARDTLLAQYVFNRLATARGLVNNVTDRSPCDPLANDSRSRQADELEAETAEWLNYFNYAICGPAFLTCLMIGSYIDFLGRRLNLILPVIAFFIRMALTTAIVKWELDLRYLYIAYGIEGMGGSWFAILVGLYSLTADINASKRGRTFWINLISCCTIITGAGSNISVGYLIHTVGYFYACVLITSMMALSVVIVIFSLEETFPVNMRPKSQGKNPLLYIRRILSFYIFDGSRRKRATFCMLLSVFIFGVASEINLGSLDALYQLMKPFCWDSTQIGNYVAIRSAGTAFFGMLALHLLQCCMAEEKIGLVSILSQGAALTFESFIKVDWYFYLVPVLLIPENPFSSIVRSLMSILAGPDKQGSLFSSIAIMESLCQLVSATAFNKFFAATVSYMPGAVYLLMASCGFVSFILFGIYFCVREPPQLRYEKVFLVNPDNETEKH